MFIEQDEEKNKNVPQTPGNQVGAGAGGFNISGSSNTPQGNPSTITPVQTNQPQPKFASAQDYLKANQAQGETLANDFTGALNTTLGTEKTSIDTAANKTKGDINAGVTAYDPTLVETAVKDPTKITGDPNMMTNFLKQYNASYTGPTSFENSANYGDAASAATEAGQKAAQIKTTGGRQQLLKDQFGNTTAGGSALDQGILQNSSAFPTVQEQGKQFKGMTDYLNTQSGDVGTAAKTAADTTEATKTQTQGAFENNLTKFSDELGARTKAAQDTAAAKGNAYTDALKSGDATKVAEALKNSNLTEAQRTNLVDYLTEINKSYGSNPDLSNFYNYNPATDITNANVASAEDYAKADAYKKLTGVDYSGVLNPADAAKAGVMQDPNAQFNTTNADQGLRAYLIQKEKEALNAQPGVSDGSSTPGEAKKDILDKGGLVDKAAGALITAPLGGIGAIPGASGIISGIGKMATKIGDSLGFGGKHHDVTVNLPELKLPEMAIPKTANAATTKAITGVFNKPLNTAGSYHEGAVGDMVGRLDVLKDALDKGQISQEEYTGYAAPLAKWANSAYNTILSSGHTAGKTVEGSYPSFQNKYGNLLKI